MELLDLPIFVVAHKRKFKIEVCVVVIQPLYDILFLEVLDEIDFDTQDSSLSL